ncbi:helix-turn-helix domain-containing protein [Draconibacterium mangrovi]|uniref:helix-turn-helix domain-containing protein n=1 Tax=Draconibacterium mangrovi TaxID=2697469 RepID=UPI0037424544
MFGRHANNSTTQNSEFLSELRGIVLQNLLENDFGVNVLAKEVRLSRSQLHRRLKCITGKSPSCFIREIRLLHASELLKENNNTVSEIAYKVGFGSPSYFNKCFHDYFGHSPGVHKHFSASQNNLTNHPEFPGKVKRCSGLYHKTVRYFGFIIIALILVILMLYLVFWL